MELDQRVKALEYEMKILKNEIQRTLLDIQEQVLVHYYPSLRSEDAQVPTEAVTQFSRAQAANSAAQPPVAKKVSLDEIRATQTPPAAPAAAPKPAGAFNQATMVKLAEWVNESIARLGGGRVSRLIEQCVVKGILDADTKAILLRLTSLNKEPDPERVAANDVLSTVLKLDEVLGRAGDVDEALALMEEANLG